MNEYDPNGNGLGDESAVAGTEPNAPITTTPTTPETPDQYEARWNKWFTPVTQRFGEMERQFGHVIEAVNGLRQSQPTPPDTTWQHIEEQAPDLAPLVRPMYEQNQALQAKIDRMEKSLQPLILTTQQQQARASDIAAIQQRYPGENAEAIYAEYLHRNTDPWQAVDSIVSSKKTQTHAATIASGQAGRPLNQTTVLPSGPNGAETMTQQEAQGKVQEMIDTNKAMAFRENYPEQWSLLRRRAAGENVIVS